MADPDRPEQVVRRLAEWGLGGWSVEPLVPDASRRRYLRLRSGAETRIVMDLPPGAAERLADVVRIGAHLRGLGLAAPEVLHLDEGLGLAVLEDLGPTQAARHLDAAPEDEAKVCVAAAEVLARVQSAPPPSGLFRIDAAAGARMLAPLFEAADLDPGARARIAEAMFDSLSRDAPGPFVLSLRDFHAENLIWRPDRQGTDRLGLLDFQDAVEAPAAYDLASLLDDVRRDVSPGTERAVFDRFAALTGADPRALTRARAVLSVQRNLRIAGVFARLIHREGKTRYRAFLPRLRRHLDRHLADPALDLLRPEVAPVLAMPGLWT